MSTRALWFESHLLSEPAGRRAQRAAEALGKEVHEYLLSTGDQLAKDSAIVAQQFYRQAAATWQMLGRADFEIWTSLGMAQLSGDSANRDAALAIFSVPPKVLGQCGMESLRSWDELARTIAKSSRRLAATFLATTAPLLAKLSAALVREWAQQGLRLFGTSGWRGEFLAQAFFASAPHALPILSVADVAVWADLGVALLPAIKETEFYKSLPDGLAGLSANERSLLLLAVRRGAPSNVKAALVVYRQLPSTVRRMPSAYRGRLLTIVYSGAAEAIDDLAELAPVCGALVKDLPRQQRSIALALAEQVANQFPRASAAILRSMPTAFEISGQEPISGWVKRGLEIATDNSDAGLAYFALQSRTSLKVLEAVSTAVSLNEVQGLLRKYVQMLSGRSATIRTADTASLRSPLEEFPLENEIALPLRIDRFATHEDNVDVYRFLAAQLAGRRELSTYAVQLPDGHTSLAEYLRADQQPPLLEPMFLLVEGFRVAAAMGRTYPGLAVEQRRLARRLLARVQSDHLPSQTELLDTTLMWLLAGAEPHGLPAWLSVTAHLVAAFVAPLASTSATADDSLAIAQRLVEELSRMADATLQASLIDSPSEALSAEALLDQYIYDYDAESDAPSTGPASSDAPSGTEPYDLPEDTKLQLQDEQEEPQGPTTPLSAEALQKLIEAGADIRMKQGYSEDIEGLGLYITDLLGKLPSEQLQELKRLLYQGQKVDRAAPRRWLENRGEGASFYYDEWDYHIADYRQRWCRLREVPTESDSGEFFHATLLEYSALIPEVRRQFQKIRPEMYRVIRGLEDGEDFDLNAVVNARVDRRAKRAPSSKLYTARVREERDVATLFLIDMSASTDEPLQKPPASARQEVPGAVDDVLLPPLQASSKQRRIIDVTKEALVIMAEALEEIGDAYAIYGFSGHGRQNVEFYLVKSFNESLSPTVKGRIGALEPKRSTRMGAALRHATEKMAGLSSRARHIILLSDGFPQDFDYGQDRRSNVYGLRDTTIALRECESAGITPFCITVDKAGHDYLREMCDGARYMVIDDIASLPRELPKIYQRVVGG